VFTAPRLLTGPESLLLAASAAVLGAFLAARFKRWPSSGARAAGAVAAALVASTLAVAPVTAWGIFSDIRAAHRLSERDAERIGPEENLLDTSVIDRVAALIPRGDTYALVLSQTVDVDRRRVFRLWSLPALLPRIASKDPSSSDWVVSWGVSPPDLGVSVADVHVLEHRQGSLPPVYVARVVE
jgi:hypothetical protein